MKLTVMTYNIQHGLVYRSDPPTIDLSAAAAVIRESGADFVGLNEVRGRGVRADYTAQAETMAALLGWHCFFGKSIDVSGPNPYGNAVLSRFPITETRVCHIPDPKESERDRRFEHRSVTRAVISLPEGSGAFTVFSSHFGLSKAERRNAAETVLALAEREENPFAIMGDFNTDPTDPVLAPLFERYDEAGAYCPGYTFPSDRPSCRIDYLFCSPDTRIESARVIPAEASDHRPVLAEISF
ncbi:MAG: endonuclease/exonuclease/phosphatase family protein [Clostridia bacterium]|nr:endonuclease/exonuclease/phosphatase family protein [Clostridia bacterium]